MTFCEKITENALPIIAIKTCIFHTQVHIFYMYFPYMYTNIIAKHFCDSIIKIQFFTKNWNNSFWSAEA